MKAAIPERFTWAGKLMAINPGDSVMEIGCGAGLLAECISAQLTTGHLTAVDRSLPMLEKARKRNRRYIETRISEFICADFGDCNFPADSYDKVVAFNVNFFWKAPDVELGTIRSILKKTGKLYIFYDSPNNLSARAAEPVKERLLAGGFDVTSGQLKDRLPGSAFAIEAQPVFR